MPHLRSAAAAALLLLVWLGYFTALQWSVVRYRLAIVLVLSSAAVLLGTAVVRRWQLDRLPRPVLAAALLIAGLVAEVVPFFSHVSADQRRLLAHLVLGTAVLAAAALVLPDPRGRLLSTAVTAAGAVVWTVAAIRLDPAPRIDVWVTLQQAADGLGRGQNFYAMTWQDSPGVQDAFTYLPWTAVLLAPGRWLAGDVRWALLVVLLVGVLCLAALGATTTSHDGRRGRPSALALGAAALLLLAPGSVTQAEQAWTEPLLFTCLAAWALLMHRGQAWWAVLPLALGCASKQHLAVLLPVLACWSAFGWRRTLATAGITGGLVLPWFLVDPSAFWHDTVALLVTFHPIRFANTWFIAAQTELGRTPPFWLTGLVVLGVLTAACLAVSRRQPPLSELLGWLALLLLTASLVNKQGFYNQYWLVGSLVALALAAQPSSRSTGSPASSDANLAARSSQRH